MSFQIERDAFCEHCLHLDPYELTWSEEEDGCTWCMTCAECGDFEFEHSNDEVAEWEEKARLKQLEYYRERVESLERSSPAGAKNH